MIANDCNDVKFIKMMAFVLPDLKQRIYSYQPLHLIKHPNVMSGTDIFEANHVGDATADAKEQDEE